MKRILKFAAFYVIVGPLVAALVFNLIVVVTHPDFGGQVEADTGLSWWSIAQLLEDVKVFFLTLPFTAIGAYVSGGAFFAFVGLVAGAWQNKFNNVPIAVPIISICVASLGYALIFGWLSWFLVEPGRVVLWFGPLFVAVLAIPSIQKKYLRQKI